jgi:hypothetical protein
MPTENRNLDLRTIVTESLIGMIATVTQESTAAPL